MRSQPQPNPPDASVGDADRRREIRQPSSLGQVTLRAADRLGAAAVVLDESFQGVSLLVNDAQGVQVGDEVQVLFCGLPYSGTIRSVVPWTSTVRVGLEWNQAPEN